MIEEILKQEIEKCLAELYLATEQIIQFQKTIVESFKKRTRTNC